MSKNGKGNHKHRKNCPFVWVICGETGYTTPARIAISKYCSKRCRKESQERARQENYIPPVYGPKIGGPWKIVKDPDRTWGHNSSLGLTEIKRLAKLSYLTPGTRFRHIRKGEECEVVEIPSGDLELIYR
jgi:hypothetical protein